MRRVSERMSQANAWPSHVLTLSTNSISFCMDYLDEKKTPSGGCRMVSFGTSRSALLRLGLLRFRGLGRLGLGGRPGLCGRLGVLGAEVGVVGHAPIHIRVEVPANGALGEYLLRGEDLDEERVVLALVDDGIEDFELLAQDRVRRLVALQLFLGL